jgi:TrpR-related protein YerC/YecD
MYQSKLENPETDALFRAVLTLENMEDCYRFFEDICTINEIKALAQRFEVARMLRAGTTFNVIAQKTGASTATISRVNRCLRYGSDGYTLALDRIGE